jgi:hypothetical protein
LCGRGVAEREGAIQKELLECHVAPKQLRLIAVIEFPIRRWRQNEAYKNFRVEKSIMIKYVDCMTISIRFIPYLSLCFFVFLNGASDDDKMKGYQGIDLILNSQID